MEQRLLRVGMEIGIAPIGARRRRLSTLRAATVAELGVQRSPSVDGTRSGVRVRFQDGHSAVVDAGRIRKLAQGELHGRN